MRPRKMTAPVRKTPPGFRYAALFAATLALGGTALLISGCGSGEPEPRPNDAGYPFDEVKTGADGIPVPAKLTGPQKADVLAIAKADPLIQEMLAGHEVEWRKPYPWSRPNMELLGGAVDVHFAEAADLSGKTIPYIENTEELYGRSGAEGVILEEGEPRVEPVIGTTRSPYGDDVRAVSILVDLEAGQVAQVLQIR